MCQEKRKLPTIMLSNIRLSIFLKSTKTDMSNTFLKKESKKESNIKPLKDKSFTNLDRKLFNKFNMSNNLCRLFNMFNNLLFKKLSNNLLLSMFNNLFNRSSMFNNLSNRSSMFNNPFNNRSNMSNK